MSNSDSTGVICAPVDNRPAQEPDAVCEGCGVRGTVGRASRHDATGAFVEEHRYCADCWPEWSAFYRARWDEQGRRASLAWCERPLEGPDTPPPPNWGMVFVSATWHDVIDLVQRLTDMARYYREPPSREALARAAAGIRKSAAERVGAMPVEVRAFLAEFGQDSPAAPAS